MITLTHLTGCKCISRIRFLWTSIASVLFYSIECHDRGFFVLVMTPVRPCIALLVWTADTMTVLYDSAISQAQVKASYHDVLTLFNNTQSNTSYWICCRHICHNIYFMVDGIKNWLSTSADVSGQTWCIYYVQQLQSHVFHLSFLHYKV